MPVSELNDHPGVAANGLEVRVQSGQQQIVRLFDTTDRRLAHAELLRQLNLGQIRSLTQRSQAHCVGTVGVFHLTADSRDVFG